MKERQATVRPSDSWVSGTTERSDVVTASVLSRFAAFLDRSDPTSDNPLWHWAFFSDATFRADLGVDGHPRRGGFLPPIDLPRRMHAGFRLDRQHASPLAGESCARASRVLKVEEKNGSSGPLVFVTVEHRLLVAEELNAVEEQDIVYVGSAPSEQGDNGTEELGIPSAPFEQEVTPDPVMLFRFSALTNNAHRIHYDYNYVTKVENYPDLVVQGPLIALLLCELGQSGDSHGRLIRFEFRAARPAYVGEPLSLRGWLTSSNSGSQVDLRAYRSDGQIAASAKASFGPHESTD